MAIIQISKIQHRTGANTDLPQLSEGEFGFATDERKLYIGNDPNLYPPANSSTTTQTEILTEVSTLNFARLGGSANTSLNLTAPVENGQLLVADGNVWINAGGTAGGYINLGSISNIAISGGINGYVMSTDGLGNLSWKSAGVVSYDIADVSQANPAVVTTITDNEVITGIAVTIIGVGGMVELPTAGTSGTNKFFALRLTSTTFELYKDSAYLIPIDSTGFTAATTNTGTATISFYEAGNGTPGGANTNIQFNDGSGLFGGTANLTFNKVTNKLSLNGNANISNVNANFFGPLTGRVGATTPNTGAFTTITATSSISAAGNITGANTRVNGLISITGNLTAGNIRTAGTANINNIDVTGNVLGGLKPVGNNVQDLGTPTQRWRDLWLSGNTIYVGDQTISTSPDSVTISGNTAYANDLVVANVYATNLTGTLLTAAQPYITNVGILTSLTVNGPVDFTGTSGLLIPGGSNGYILTTDGNGVTSWRPPLQELAKAAGTNSEIQFNDQTNFGATSEFTFDSVFNTLTVPNANITTITASTLTVPVITSSSLITAGNLIVTGNSSVNNFSISGTLSLQGNLNSGNIIANGSISANGVVTATNFITPGIVSVGGNVNAGNILTPGSVSVGGTLTVVDFAVGNIIQTGFLSALGEIKGSNLIANGVVSASGNITGSNVFTSGRISAVGNAVAGNFLTGGGFFGSSIIVSGNANVGALNSSSGISAAGNIVGANVVSNGIISATGNLTAAAISTGIISATGAVSAASISTSGDISATGNLSGNNLTILGGFSVTGNVTGGNLVTNGSINANGNAVVNGNISSNGIFSTSGNITGANTTANGDLLVTGNANTVNLGTSGFITAIGNITGSNLRATGLLSVTGTATVGNISTAGFISAAGNITGNVATANTLSVIGNASFGNAASAGLISAAGNIVGANLLTDGQLSAAGNITGANLSIAAVTATGNVTGQNFASTGNLSVTGNIISMNTSNLFILNVNNTANLGLISNVKIQGGVVGQLISTDGNGNLSFSSPAGLVPAGANTQVQYNNNGSYGASANFVFDRTSNTLFATNLTGNIKTANQPNITSLGILTSVSVSGNSVLSTVTAASVSTTGSITGANLTSTAQAFINGNLTSNNTLRSPFLSITNTANVSNLNIGNALTIPAPANLKIAGGFNNWVLTTNGSGNLTWAPQSGAGGLPGGPEYAVQWNDNLVFGGDSNLLYNPTTGTLSAAFLSGDGYQISNLTVDAGSFIVNGNSNIVIDSNSFIHMSAEGLADVVLIDSTGANVKGILNSTDALTTGGNVTSLNANLGNLATANFFTGTLTTAEQPNVTSLGTLTDLSVLGNVTANFFIGDGSNLSNITAANITGAIADANFAAYAANVTSASQGNITSLGTLTGLSVNGNSNLGAIGNVHITGGTDSQTIITDGTGNLSFATIANTSVVTDNFTGDGFNQVFVLSTIPASKDYVTVNYNGVITLRNTYTVVGSTVTLSSPPTLNSPIEISTVLVGSGGVFNQTLNTTSNVEFNDVTLSGILSAPQQTKASNDPGTVGQICWDSGFIYVCTASNVWKRAGLTGGY